MEGCAGGVWQARCSDWLTDWSGRNNNAAFVAFAVFTLGNLVIIARRTSAVAGVR